MRLVFYGDRILTTVPEYLFDVLDSYDERFEAAFANYGDQPMHVVVAWGTTGFEKGQPSATLVITRDHIITGYIDRLINETDAPTEEDEWDEAVDGPWPGYDEPSPKERLKRMLALYRRRTQARYFIVHDTEANEPWLEQGFTVVSPPDNVPAEAAVRVLTWGTTPKPLVDFLRQRGLPWARNVHRGFVP